MLSVSGASWDTCLIVFRYVHLYDCLHEALSIIGMMDNALLDASMCRALPKNWEDDSNSLIKVYRRAVSTLMWHRSFYTTNQTFNLTEIWASSGKRVAANKRLQRQIAALWMNLNVLANQQRACGGTARHRALTAEKTYNSNGGLSDGERRGTHKSFQSATLFGWDHAHKQSVRSLSTDFRGQAEPSTQLLSVGFVARFRSRYVLTHPLLREWRRCTWCRKSRSQLAGALCCHLLRGKSWVWRPL